MNRRLCNQVTASHPFLFYISKASCFPLVLNVVRLVLNYIFMKQMQNCILEYISPSDLLKALP